MYAASAQKLHAYTIAKECFLLLFFPFFLLEANNLLLNFLEIGVSGRGKTNPTTITRDNEINQWVLYSQQVKFNVFDNHLQVIRT